MSGSLKRRRPEEQDAQAAPAVCPICIDVLVNPVLLTRCCGGIVCTACLKRNFEINSKRCPLCAATILNWFHHAEQRDELCPPQLQERIAVAVAALGQALPGSPEVSHRSLAADGELRAEYEALVATGKEAMAREELAQVSVRALPRGWICAAI